MVSAYRPSSFRNLLLAKHFQEPVRGAPNLQIIHAGTSHAHVQQVHAGVTLEINSFAIEKRVGKCLMQF